MVMKMSSPQLENGYTRIANELLEETAKLKLNGTQFRIIHILWRYTYGFQRKEHDFSVNFLCKALGMKRSQEKQIRRELEELMAIKVVNEIKQPTKNSARKLSFNKDYSQWIHKTSGLLRPEVKKDQAERTKKTTPTLDYLDHQEINKENFKDILLSPEQEKIFSLLATVKGYPINQEKDLEMIKRLSEKYPSVDLVAVVEDWAINKLDNPLKPKDSPRSQINTWIKKANLWKQDIIPTNKYAHVKM